MATTSWDGPLKTLDGTASAGDIRKVDTPASETQIADSASVARLVRSLASDILVKFDGTESLALVGIRRGGYEVAKQLVAQMRELEGEPLLGSVDITLYRDDGFRGLPKPQIGATELPFVLDKYRVVLVDDVLFTGRTVRAALDALNDFGRAKIVELAVLVDRGGRELPIQPNYCGMKVEAGPAESVRVLGQAKEDMRIVKRSQSASA